jgi:RNA-directed DNA polymerase
LAVTSVLPAWFRQRRYLHFDEPLSFPKAQALVTDPASVAAHAFWPLLRFNVQTSKIKYDKSSDQLISTLKDRPISYAAHSDSQIFSYYCEMLSVLYEAEIEARGLSDAVLAFRSLGKNNIDFAKNAFDEIRSRGNCVAIALDITKFFDTIDHAQLKARWKAVLGRPDLPADHYAVFRALTRYAVAERDEVFKALGISLNNPRTGRRKLCEPFEFREKVRQQGYVKKNPDPFGIPQGTAISAMLSNLYMLNFDIAAQTFAKSYGGCYMRYCDDMLFVMPKGMTVDVESFVDVQIKSLKLEINSAKTDRCEFTISNGVLGTKKPLQYLGFLFDGQRVVIRSAAFAKFSNRMKRGVSLAKQTMFSRNKLRQLSGVGARELYLKTVYARYSHLGKRNFLRYGYKASRVMQSPAIRRQLRPLWGRLRDAIEK